MKKTIIVSLFGITAAALAGAAAPGVEKSDGDAKALLERKCGTCHTIDLSTSQKKTRREWERTISRMKNVNGASLTGQETQAIVEYLAINHGE
jgi:cytochrome c5